MGKICFVQASKQPCRCDQGNFALYWAFVGQIYSTKSMEAWTFFLRWLRMLIWFSNSPPVPQLKWSSVSPLSTCHTKIPQASLSSPGLWVPAAHLNLSLLSSPQRHQRAQKVGHRELIAHTHTHTHTHIEKNASRIVAKKYPFCDRDLRVRQRNICCYLWAASTKWGIQWLFKDPVSAGQLGLHCYYFN